MTRTLETFIRERWDAGHTSYADLARKILRYMGYETIPRGDSEDLVTFIMDEVARGLTDLPEDRKVYLTYKDSSTTRDIVDLYVTAQKTSQYTPEQFLKIKDDYERWTLSMAGDRTPCFLHGSEEMCESGDPCIYHRRVELKIFYNKKLASNKTECHIPAAFIAGITSRLKDTKCTVNDNRMVRSVYRDLLVDTLVEYIIPDRNGPSYDSSMVSAYREGRIRIGDRLVDAVSSAPMDRVFEGLRVHSTYLTDTKNYRFRRKLGDLLRLAGIRAIDKRDYTRWTSDILTAKVNPGDSECAALILNIYCFYADHLKMSRMYWMKIIHGNTGFFSRIEGDPKFFASFLVAFGVVVDIRGQNVKAAIEAFCLGLPSKPSASQLVEYLSSRSTRSMNDCVQKNMAAYGTYTAQNYVRMIRRIIQPSGTSTLF